MQQSFGKFFRVNEQIKASEVRVVGENGEVVGILSLQEAIKLAKDAALDLVEVSPNVNPPVCKIANFGKMKYEMQKKANDSKKKQKVVDTKEIKMTINIGKNDFDVKVKQIIKFINKGDKVKVSLRMKGREVTHLELAEKMIASISEELEEHAKFEFSPKMEGRQMVAILVKK